MVSAETNRKVGTYTLGVQLKAESKDLSSKVKFKRG